MLNSFVLVCVHVCKVPQQVNMIKQTHTELQNLFCLTHMVKHDKTCSPKQRPWAHGKMDRRRFGLLAVTGLRLNTLVVWPSQANEALMKGLRRTHRMTGSLITYIQFSSQAHTPANKITTGYIRNRFPLKIPFNKFPLTFSLSIVEPYTEKKLL